MATRDRWDKEIKCAKCDNNGTAKYSEDDYPYMKAHGHFQVDYWPTSFSIVSKGNSGRPVKVECLACNTVFNL